MKRITSILFLLALLISACAPAATPAPTQAPATEAPTVVPTDTPIPAPTTPANPTLILATTTSTQDSGLLDVLIPLFEAESGFTVQTVAVGSGQAMQMGQDGNADALLVHSPAAEKQFMTDGWGRDRALVMHNDFIVVGPADDPAAIKGLSALEAFKAIAAGEGTFVARADKSGTSTKELGIWKKAELDPATTKPAWYVETGQGMGASLTIASEKAGYTLTDRHFPRQQGQSAA
jgi:tungstate transport system substrate-binding protein